MSLASDSVHLVQWVLIHCTTPELRQIIKPKALPVSPSYDYILLTLTLHPYQTSLLVFWRRAGLVTLSKCYSTPCGFTGC